MPQSQTVLLWWWEPKQTLLQVIREKSNRLLEKGWRWNKTRRKEGQEAVSRTSLSLKPAQKPAKTWRRCLILFWTLVCRWTMKKLRTIPCDGHLGLICNRSHQIHGMTLKSAVDYKFVCLLMFVLWLPSNRVVRSASETLDKDLQTAYNNSLSMRQKKRRFEARNTNFSPDLQFLV